MGLVLDHKFGHYCSTPLAHGDLSNVCSCCNPAIDVSIPFPDRRTAEIVFKTVSVDREPSAATQKEFHLEGSTLKMTVKATLLKTLVTS